MVYKLTWPSKTSFVRCPRVSASYSKLVPTFLSFSAVYDPPRERVSD